MNRTILSGNEAIALGAFLSGVAVMAGYPGTPSSEIIPAFASYETGHAQWAPNEKVALEVAIGAAYQGARGLATMKHVGLNVAADPLFSVSYVSLRGGLVVITADDVGMFSSQNEQDNRHLARASKCVLLEPADSQECLDFVRLGFEMSEQFDTPVIVRTTTRTSHGVSVVHYDPGSREPIRARDFERDHDKYALLPAVSRQRRVIIEDRQRRLEEYGEGSDANRVEWGDRSLGIITSGVSYLYAKEALPQASFLKLGQVWPLPTKLVEEFARGVKRAVVVEECEPFIESEVRLLGLDVLGKKLFTSIGEYSKDLILQGLARVPELNIEYVPTEGHGTEAALPDRPPVLCPGCPHRPVFYTLKRLDADVYGDIGCFSLAGLPPLDTMHTTVCMGASLPMALGAEKAADEAGLRDKRYRVAVLGDSGFFHSGMTGLVNVVHNRGNSKFVILDNRTTAMTGHQDHPGIGHAIDNQPTIGLDIAAMARTMGVDDVKVVDPMDLSTLYREMKDSLDRPGPSVIVATYPCTLIDPLARHRAPVRIDPDKCNGCGACLKFGCPGVHKNRDKAVIDPSVCSGCEVCVQLCPRDAAGVRAKSNLPAWETVLQALG